MSGDISRWRSWLAVLITLSLSLLIAGLIAEAILRFAMKDQINLFPRFHDEVTYGDFTIRRYRPGLSFWHTSIDGRWKFDINNKGFRDSEDYQHEKAAGQIRVLALGDSHTSGYEVRQEFAYPEQVERLLKSRGVDAQSLNAGISGFGTAEQLIYLENEGVLYAPDYVVVGFYANDFEDNVKAGLFRIRDGILATEKTRHTPGIRVHQLVANIGILRWLSQNSYFYSFTFNTAYVMAKRALLSRELARVQTEFAIPTAEKVGDYEQELMSALLKRMYEIVGQTGATLIIVDIPRVTGSNRPIRSSVPQELRADFTDRSDVLLLSETVFAPFRGDPSQMHVQHGQRHISESAHMTIAQAIVDAIWEDIETGTK